MSRRLCHAAAQQAVAADGAGSGLRFIGVGKAGPAAERHVRWADKGRVYRMSADLDLLLMLEPHGTFHDAELLSVAIDRDAGQLVAEFSVCVGDPSADDEAFRERRRRGRLELRGLLVWSAPPSHGSWLTSYGPLVEAPTEAGKAIASSLPAACSSWWLYFADTNDFTYCATEQYAWVWGPDEV